MGVTDKPKASASSVEIRFNGIKAGEQSPVVALYSVDANGRATKKLSVQEGTRLNIPAEATKGGMIVAVGPDVKNPSELPSELLVQYRTEDFARVAGTGVMEFPPGVWPGWLYPNVCVSGKAEKCSIFAIARESMAINPRFRPPSVGWCAPLCNGIVEVYEQLCCCRWWIDPVDISSIIDKLKQIIAVQPPIWPPGPGPDPGPWERAALQNEVEAMRASAPQAQGPVLTSLPFAKEAPLGVMHFDAMAEVVKLQSMPEAQAVKYVRNTEYLRPFWCSCSSRKVGEAVLNPDGTFSFCYYRPLIFPLPGYYCNYRYMYKVKQWDGNAWVTVYDGVALHQSFAQGVNALLETYSGHACDPGGPDYPDPYVMLENISDTQSWHLVSQSQTGELTLAVVADNGGLVFPPAPMTSDLGQMENCPWGATLPFRLRFHPAVAGALGGKYYRISVVPTNDGSNASGPPIILKAPIAWSYFQIVMGTWTVLTDTLGPNTVGAQQGLYLIPDPGKDWEWYQFHNYWDTTSVPNGRYFVVVEIFDAAGNRLKPTGASGAGNPANFVFLKWEDATTLSPVHQADLVHLFWVDNLGTYARITDLRMNGNPNMAECQYLTGTCADTFSIGYRAYHATRNSMSQPETFMLYSEIWYTRGFGNVPPPPPGPEWMYTNEPATLGGGSPATSVPRDFCSMLGIQKGDHKKCTFAVNLYVWAKHWNGGGRLSQYDSSDQASFSLEV